MLSYKSVVLHAENGGKIAWAHQGWDFGITSPKSVLICLPAREVHWNNTAPCDYIFIENSGKQDCYIWSLPRYWRSFWLHFMWHHNRDYQIAWAWRHNLSIKLLHAGWQKNHNHACRRKSRGVCGQGLSAGVPSLWNLVVDELVRWLSGKDCYALGRQVTLLSSSPENYQHCLRSLIGGFEYSTAVVW